MARETRQQLLERVADLEAENEALSETLDEIYELVSPDGDDESGADEESDDDPDE